MREEKGSPWRYNINSLFCKDFYGRGDVINVCFNVSLQYGALGSNTVVQHNIVSTYSLHNIRKEILGLSGKSRVW